MGLKFLERDEKVLYVSEVWETYKAILGITDVSEIPRLFKKGHHPALLIIDEQYAFTSPDSITGTKGVSEEARLLLEGMVENTKVLLGAVRKKQIPIFYFYSSSREDGTDLGVLGEKTPMLTKILRDGTKMVEIDERIKPQKNDYVMVKKMPSAFFGTPLNMILKRLNVDVNIVVGNSTSGCARATAMDSVQNAYYTVIPEECIADRCVGSHKASLADMLMKYMDVVSLDELLGWIATLK